MKNNKAPGIDNLTSDIMILGGEESLKQITKCFNQIAEKDAKMILLHKRDMRDIKKKKKKITGFPTCTNCSLVYYLKKKE